MNSVNKTFSIQKNRNFVLGLLFLTFISAVLIFYSEPGIAFFSFPSKYLRFYNTLFLVSDVIDEENRVMKDLGELHLKEQHTNLLFHLLREETGDVLKKINDALSAFPPNISVDPDVKLIFANFSKTTASYFRVNNTLKPPSIFNFLPHLLSDASSLRPIYHFTKHRSGGSSIL